MDRVMEKFRDGVRDRFGDRGITMLAQSVPTEMQGYAGVLRGAFAEGADAPLTVRLMVEPWDTDDRWQVMVRGRELGPTKFWDWLADQELCRIPFVSADFVSQCQQCGETPCLHGAALTHHWLERARSVPEFFWLLLNRRGKNRHMAVNLQPIVHVPIMLGTNLDRTRQDLVAIVEAAFNRASWERDNMFGGEPGAPDGQR